MTELIRRKQTGGAWETAQEGGGSATIEVAPISVTPTQVLNLKNAPVQILPSPGPGKIHLIIAAWLRRQGGDTPYTPTEVTWLEIGAAEAVAGDWSTWETATDPYFMCSDDPDLPDSQQMICQFPNEGSGIPINTMEDQPMVIKSLNANWTGGNYGIGGFVYYTVIDV